MSEAKLYDVHTDRFGTVTLSGRRTIGEARADARQAFGREVRVVAHRAREPRLCSCCDSSPSFCPRNGSAA